MVSNRRAVTTVAGLFALSIALHYVLFGALPFGTPQLLDDELGA
jgi:hypothetical protein